MQRHTEDASVSRLSPEGVTFTALHSLYPILGLGQCLLHWSSSGALPAP